jgi:hypothetical protein
VIGSSSACNAAGGTGLCGSNLANSQRRTLGYRTYVQCVCVLSVCSIYEHLLAYRPCILMRGKTPVNSFSPERVSFVLVLLVLLSHHRRRIVHSQSGSIRRRRGRPSNSSRHFPRDPPELAPPGSGRHYGPSFRDRVAGMPNHEVSRHHRALGRIPSLSARSDPSSREAITDGDVHAFREVGGRPVLKTIAPVSDLGGE